MVLLGIADPKRGDFPLLSLAGFMFPVLGILYRELTILTIDKADLTDLRYSRDYFSNSLLRERSIAVKWVRPFRRAILRIMLLVPSSLWLLESNNLNPHDYFWSMWLLLFYAAVAGLAEIALKDEKRPR